MRLIDADAAIKQLRESRCTYCDRRKGMKNGKIKFCYEIGDAPCRACDIGDTMDYFDEVPTIDAIPIEIAAKKLQRAFHSESWEAWATWLKYGMEEEQGARK